MMRFVWAICLASLSIANSPLAFSQSTQPVALELILALDSSTSVSDQEFELQSQGLANAFGEDAVIKAVIDRAQASVAVAVVQWSDAQHQSVSVDWRVLRSEEDCLQLAAEFRNMKRRLRGGTAISGVLDYARELIMRNAFEGLQKIIDVSGDGPDLHFVHVKKARDRAVAAGITVNGLAIIDDDENLQAFYRNHVIGGDNAFVMTANDYSDFSAAIRQKLVRELGGPQLAKIWVE